MQKRYEIQENEFIVFVYSIYNKVKKYYYKQLMPPHSHIELIAKLCNTFRF